MAIGKVCRGYKSNNDNDNGTNTITFQRHIDAANWLIEKYDIHFTTNTVAQKISQAIRENTPFCGYWWCDEESVINTGYNIGNDNPTPNNLNMSKGAKVSVQPSWTLELQQQLDAQNKQISKERSDVYNASLGLQSILNKNLPQYKYKEDILRATDIPNDEYNLAILTEEGWVAANDIAQAISLIHFDAGKEDIASVLESGVINNVPIKVGEYYRNILQDYLKKFSN